MMASNPPIVKQEPIDDHARPPPPSSAAVIDVSSGCSDSDSGVEDDVVVSDSLKRPRVSNAGPKNGENTPKRRKSGDFVLPVGFLDPLPPEKPSPPTMVLAPRPISVARPPTATVRSCKQFWKAGDYEGPAVADSASFSAGMDHVRVHPKFLHSNATSHKWALGALAELLDNSMDEVCHGATFVNIDMLKNTKDGSKLLIIEDNGGGMDPDKMRHCMSLGYSLKSKSANTIGQYGNGFKTSTMRLGADVIVFSRCCGKEGRSSSQSIGLLSYTFLRSTGKEDIVVPMIDYEKRGEVWSKMTRSSSDVWNNNLETILQWSPYYSEADLLYQFDLMADQGTRIVIYNLWDDDQGELELDFEADKHDIQVRGVNRDEKKIEMAKQFPNSMHFLTYRHSLRSYASILYLRLPRGFKMILRGKEIEHHNIVDDMMLKQDITYRPQPGPDGVPKDPSMLAVVNIGFVKDAKDHIDVQGFNVYHKNRLIKPFWRVWNAAGSDGRGVIGVLEANFVEPAHDKQGFERTTVLSRLEARLLQMQKTYWTTNCHKIGYAPRRNKKFINGFEDKERSPETPPRPSSQCSKKDTSASSISAPRPSSQCSKKDTSASSISADVSKSQYLAKHHNAKKSLSNSSHKMAGIGTSVLSTKESGTKYAENFDKKSRGGETFENMVDSPPQSPVHDRPCAANNQKQYENECTSTQGPDMEGGAGTDGGIAIRSCSKASNVTCNGNGPTRDASQMLIDENKALRDRLKNIESSMVCDLQYERDRTKALTKELESLETKLKEANFEQEALIDIFQEERCRRDREEETLRNKLKEASATIQELLAKLYSKESLIKPEK